MPTSSTFPPEPPEALAAGDGLAFDDGVAFEEVFPVVEPPHAATVVPAASSPAPTAISRRREWIENVGATSLPPEKIANQVAARYQPRRLPYAR